MSNASYEKRAYDAFISYRHLSPDQEIAEQVQKLLESYRPPKALKTLKKRRIARIFRDRTELPTVGGLDDALKEALNQSDYLIVVLSSKLQESKWCMEEIRTFKEAHGGKIDRILPILVEGEPDDVIPDILRHETREVRLPDGTAQTREVELEPLCCDVRAETIKGSLKKLKTEFLRLAAPMLGVGYDDLYQRHMRRRRRIAIASVSATIALLVSVLSVISYFAYQTYQAQKRYQSNLVDTYTRQGATSGMRGESEQALLYYSEALRLDPQAQTAKTGALMLLQQQRWLNQEERIDGWILGDRAVSRATRPAALDATGEKELVSTLDGSRMVDREGRVLSDLSAYGSLIASAQNGSCWVFATQDTITFFFPEDGSISQVDRPTALHPKCDPDDLALFPDMAPIAMAIGRSRAAVCYGGYLYVFDLDETTARGTLNTTFDLGNVFEYTSEYQALTEHIFYVDNEIHDTLPVCPTTWIDDSGYLAVLYNGSTAAVFNVGHQQMCNLNHLHTQQRRTLNSVAFSPSGQYYALVYGNDNTIYDNHGGCLEVYDEYGTLLMATAFEGGTPLKGAVFDPNSTRIAAWGSGELQIWDWATGEQLITPILMRSISGVAWLEDGRLAVSDGKGQLSLHAIVGWAADASASLGTKEPETRTVSGLDLTLSTGHHFLCQTTAVHVTDADGALTDEASLLSMNTGLDFIDRMILDVRNDTVYAWHTSRTALCAFKVDGDGRITSAIELDTQGRKPLSVSAAWRGVLMEAETGELFYYEDGVTEASVMFALTSTGSIHAVASNDQGLTALIVSNQVPIEGGIGYLRKYSIWLCDLNAGLMLTQISGDASDEPTRLSITEDGHLTYTLGDAACRWLIDAPAPQADMIDALQSVSCFRLNEAQNLQIVDAAFDPWSVEGWSGLVSTVFSPPAVEVSESPSEEYDAETWLAAYRDWWFSASPESSLLKGLCNMMVASYNTAMSLGQQGDIDDIIVRFFALASEAEDDDITGIAISQLNAIINAVLRNTPENAEIVAGYYERSAMRDESRALAENNLEYLYSAYCNQVLAGLIRGQGMDAFQVGKKPLYSPYESLFLDAGMNLYQHLFSGDLQLAIEAFRASYPEKSLFDSYGDLLDELLSYVKLGILPEATYSDFVSAMGHPVGYRLTQVSAEQLAAGLRLDDLIVSVGGIHFGTSSYFLDLRETMPTAPLEIIRFGTVHYTIQPMSDWVLVGVDCILP